MTWCIGGNPNDNRWLPGCRHCMSQAEQMAKDYEPPKPHGGVYITIVRRGFRETWDTYLLCWGADGYRFDRNCPECVKAAEELAHYTFDPEWIYFYDWPRTGDTIMTGAQLSELEKRAYNRGFNAGYDSALQGSKDDIQLRIDRVNGIRKGLGIT